MSEARQVAGKRRHAAVAGPPRGPGAARGDLVAVLKTPESRSGQTRSIDAAVARLRAEGQEIRDDGHEIRDEDIVRLPPLPSSKPRNLNLLGGSCSTAAPPAAGAALCLLRDSNARELDAGETGAE